MKKDVDMLSGSIVKGLVTIAVPIMVMNVLQSLFNIIDMTVLKMFDTSGGYTVGAIGTCSMIMSLITGLLGGVASGANVIISRHLGSGDKERVERAIGSSILISLVGGFLLLIIGICFAEVFLRWNNCPDELLPDAVLYFRLYFAGVPIAMLYNFCASIIRSKGDSRSTMRYSIIAGVLKVIFTFVFVAFFKMQVAGVAIATILSWGAGAALSVAKLLRSDGIVKIKINRIRFYKKEIKDILGVGVPTGLQQAMYSIANVVISATVNTFGPDATTGISIANTFDGLLYQISIAPSLAVMSYVSQNVGHGNIKRAKESVYKGMIITICLGAGFGALSAIFSSQLSSIMASNPAVIAYSRQKMIIISSTYFICGINEIICAAMRGMGKPIIPTVCAMLYFCALRFVWVYAIFPLYRNLTFLYLVWPIGWVLSIATLLFFYFPRVKQLAALCKRREKEVDIPT